ncbi:MAG: RpiB/LacA/LacB family sugar-phosphate isomerase [Ktedonobacterales bacterium]
MKIAIGSDERTHLTDMLVAELQRRGHEVQALGPLAVAETTGPSEADWPLVSAGVAQAVVAGEADAGMVCCWTGTGASIAANKVRGVRAALCGDAETARGARIWNHANVLALSLRATSEAVAKEILDAWFDTPYSKDTWNAEQIKRIGQLEEQAYVSKDSN